MTITPQVPEMIGNDTTDDTEPMYFTDDYHGYSTNMTFTLEQNDSQMNETNGVSSLRAKYFNDVYYGVVIIVLTTCFISLVLNGCILCSKRYMHRSHLTPTLRFIFSLSGSDALGSVIQIYHFTVHSLLAKLYGVKTSSLNFCPFLFMEAVRLSILFISVLHLLALAFNHYLGIVRPLHYAATVTRRTTTLILLTIWLIPIVFNLVYFASVPGQGFQSLECKAFEFLGQRSFATTYSSLYLVPFMLMTIIYGQIFFVVRRHQLGLIRVEENKPTSEVPPNETFRKKLRRSARRFTRDFSTTNTIEERRCSTVTQMKKNVKAVVTTLLILGSYLMGWIPAVLSYCLICNDCPYPAKTFNPITNLGITGTVNTLVILKSCVNPVIYAVRIPEIRDALFLMKQKCCGRRGARGGGIKTRYGTWDTTSSTRSTNFSRRVSSKSNKSLNYVFNTVYLVNVKDKIETENDKQRTEKPAETN